MTRMTARARIISLLTLAAAVSCAAPALADDDADMPMNSARIGLYSIFYHVHTDGLEGPYVPEGTSIGAKNLQTLYLAYVRTLTTHFDVELTAGYPPLQKTVGKGPATLGSVPYDGQIIASARWLAPTALLEYEFFGPQAKFRPYFGVGVNYVNFYDRNATVAGNEASGGPTRLSLTSSVGVAGTVGLNYRISGNWHAYASYSASQVKTRLEAYTAGVERTAHINFGPQALVVAVGYSF
jgi:outer membrane protein